MNAKKTITPIAVLGYCAESGGNMAAMLLNDQRDVPFSAESVAAGLVSLYESFIDHVPENHQIAFEENFKQSFKTFFDCKAEYMSKIENLAEPTE